MNIQEFAALKLGDEIENLMTTSRGYVSEVTKAGVRVQWGQAGGAFNGFLYTASSTAWMHWSRPGTGSWSVGRSDEG